MSHSPHSARSWYIQCGCLILFVVFACVCVCVCVCAKSLLPGLTLCSRMDCSPLGPSVHRVLQASMLEQVAMLSFRGSSRPRD